MLMKEAKPIEIMRQDGEKRPFGGARWADPQRSSPASGLAKRI
jgi:hypothetical protein